MTGDARETLVLAVRDALANNVNSRTLLLMTTFDDVVDAILKHASDIGALWTDHQLSEAVEAHWSGIKISDGYDPTKEGDVRRFLEAAVEAGVLDSREPDWRWSDCWNNVPIYWLDREVEGSGQ